MRYRRLLGLGALAVSLGVAVGADDPYQWLEDISGTKALEWVHQQDAITSERLTSKPEYAGLYRDALAALDSSSRIPDVIQRGRFLYNFWRDGAHPRGIYRRVTVAGFRADHPAWQTVLDVDLLAKTEGKPWAFGGAIWPQGSDERCLIRLAPSGGDAAEVREFDLNERAFVPNGFFLPAAKSRVTWLDADSWLVGTDFGPGSLTPSGYPRVIKLWKRGTTLDAAELVYRCASTSVGVTATCLRWSELPPTRSGVRPHSGPNSVGDNERVGDNSLHLITDEISFWEAKVFQWREGRLVPLNLPPTARIIDTWQGRLVIWLKSPWTIGGASYPTGAVVVADMALLRGQGGRSEMVVAPNPALVVSAVEVTPTGILVGALDNVRGRLYRYAPAADGWARTAVEFPENGALKIDSTDERSGDAWIEYESFLTPPALYLVAGGSVVPEKIKSQSPAFDASRFEVRQHAATSADGTRIPYFVVQPKGLKLDGTAPVWMFSYGGFEIALTPAYSGSYEDVHGAYGKMWLERGGVFVLADIRGGGEFGPAWHQATLKETHYKAFEDFEAVARDLAARKITSPAHLGIEGRSNGGLLVTATMLRHPELYGAVVCGNPLVDMQRYNHLLAGASWMAEYGNPDVPEQWAYIRQYSPYQNVKAGMKLPPILFYTTTHDDRVHPGHARKMAAKMEALGYSVDYAENTEGGHHGSVTSQQLATRLALTYTFLWEHVR